MNSKMSKINDNSDKMSDISSLGITSDLNRLNINDEKNANENAVGSILNYSVETKKLIEAQSSKIKELEEKELR
ncbi:unnamed protein product [Brachionus calyciflorus]|uniref:Uncharacterized protein n=1 Tax=Brachionus calyciflorus TaxID=104777 RepID=A0A814CUK9_9BILA|nr:unnamed protein product [Brachionus calyciflorus]